jgi:hypothetical protein
LPARPAASGLWQSSLDAALSISGGKHSRNNAHQTAFGPFIDALPTIYKHDSLDKVRKLYAHEQGNLGMNDHQHVHQDLQCSRRY